MSQRERNIAQADGKPSQVLRMENKTRKKATAVPGRKMDRRPIGLELEMKGKHEILLSSLTGLRRYPFKKIFENLPWVSKILYPWSLI